MQNIPFRPQEKLHLYYKSRRLEAFFVADFLCHEKIIVELKAASGLTKEHRAQVHNYLKGTNLKLGLLVNFGHHPQLEYERIVR